MHTTKIVSCNNPLKGYNIIPCDIPRKKILSFNSSGEQEELFKERTKRWEELREKAVWAGDALLVYLCYKSQFKQGEKIQKWLEK